MKGYQVFLDDISGVYLIQVCKSAMYYCVQRDYSQSPPLPYED